ncbi:unnamed protein product [Nesidiocoris tenuis]|uniref:Peptidase C1A papain C-terminal domain-containing protein n=1 Tax=Nesidiocoris tenuis TaxID=355587 RepID=A0A6H5G2Q1_9HEMI|nr:unnamed protein product [Nesidiocoris tenuis]CAA9996296.1 unnamed protein product [Nesidiocoris tenuis]
MKLLIVALAFVATAYAGSYNILNMEDIINKVNQAHTTWTAGHNFAPDTPVSYYKNLMGVKAMTNGRRLTMMSYSGTQIPEEFDARKQWPECPTISHLLDQGNCGSCWAVAGASAFSDRLCIASNGTFTTPLSVEELLSCCDECGDGCNGGDPASAWEYFVENGLSTGGDYDSKVGCLPYTIQPCEHHTTGKRPQCSALPESDTPECQRQCQNSQYKTDFRKDHHKGVYQHVTGSYLGGHAVRVIGWGVEKGTPYWLVANSWNSDWGDNGTFKIIRGTDDCGFEDGIVAGVPA